MELVQDCRQIVERTNVTTPSPWPNAVGRVSDQEERLRRVPLVTADADDQLPVRPTAPRNPIARFRDSDREPRSAECGPYLGERLDLHRRDTHLAHAHLSRRTTKVSDRSQPPMTFHFSLD